MLETISYDASFLSAFSSVHLGQHGVRTGRSHAENFLKNPRKDADFARDSTSSIVYDSICRAVFGDGARLVFSRSIRVSMLRWLVVLILTMTVALGPSFCCCSLGTAAMLLGTSDRSASATEVSLGECCRVDAHGVPACCKKSESSSSDSLKTTRKSPQDCCKNANACRCLTASQAVLLANETSSQFEMLLCQLKLIHWQAPVDLQDSKMPRHAIQAAFDPLGLDRCRLDFLQRWNC
jgi:hypothetical protein